MCPARWVPSRKSWCASPLSGSKPGCDRSTKRLRFAISCTTLPRVNQFCYGQVRSLYGSGRFAHDLEEYLGKDETLVISEIADREDIYDAIKDFLGKGK